MLRNFDTSDMNFAQDTSVVTANIRLTETHSHMRILRLTRLRQHVDIVLAIQKVMCLVHQNGANVN